MVVVVVVENILLLEIVYNENDQVLVHIVDHLCQHPEQLLIPPILLIMMDHQQENRQFQ
jgi:hypothetical protein